MLSLFLLVLLPALLVLGLAAILLGWSSGTLNQPSRYREFSEEDRKILRDKIKSHGSNSNSFMTLYSGFSYFTAPVGSSSGKLSGIIPYVESGRVLVGAAEPLVSHEHQLEMLREFAQEAKAHGKSAMFLPVGRDLAELAHKAGYHSIFIGSEPIFDLRSYEPSLDIIPAARALFHRGAQVEEFKPSSLTTEQKRDLEEILREWLDSRKMPPLSFLNRVEPWTLEGDKKYFKVKLGGEVQAFLAGIPIWKTQGWYLVDLLRRDEAPTGSTELLLLEAMRILKEQGALEISLGVSPLSNLQRAPIGTNRGFYQILRWVYSRGNIFYRFKPLYEFKMKFRPTRVESTYLLVYPQRLGPFQILSLFETFLHGGVLSTAFLSLGRLLNRFQLNHWLRRQFSEATVVRSFPKDVRDLLYRCKNTLFFILINLLFYVSTVEQNGQIRLTALLKRGYSWENLHTYGWRVILVSPFLHHKASHIDTNLVMAGVFCGLLECFGGSYLMLLCLMGSMFSANLLLSLLLYFPLNLVSPVFWADFAKHLDIGASLGVFGCMGALVYIFKRGWILAIGLNLICIFYAWFASDLQQLNHGVATCVGILVARIYLGGV